jgi:hypothetical protein
MIPPTKKIQSKHIINRNCYSQLTNLNISVEGVVVRGRCLCDKHVNSNIGPRLYSYLTHAL